MNSYDVRGISKSLLISVKFIEETLKNILYKVVQTTQAYLFFIFFSQCRTIELSDNRAVGLPPVHTGLRLYDDHPDQARSKKGLDRGESGPIGV